MNAQLSAPLVLEELSAGMQASVPFVVRSEDMTRFAELSGDFNPLHVDDEFARDKGFEGAVVYGGLIVAKVSQLIGMHLPGRDALWTRVALDFIRPLYVDQDARVDGMVDNVSASTGMVALKLGIRLATGQLLAKGSAEVILVTH
jgi:acyl dehydratase